MMASLLSEVENEPESRPALPADLFGKVTAEGGGDLSELVRMAKLVPVDPLWHRLERYVAFRWGVRSVVWIVEGPGDWCPRLHPAAVTGAEVWQSDGWVATTLPVGPLGYALEAESYRVTADVGSLDDPPAVIFEAIRRLAMYVAQTHDDPGGSSEVDGARRSASWPARALMSSGAADLLRKFRVAP